MEEVVDEKIKLDSIFTFPAENHQTVLLTGSFHNWVNPVPMTKDEELGKFVVTIPLLLGIHQFKFIVDGEWRTSPDEPTMVDLKGNVNNCRSVRRTRASR